MVSRARIDLDDNPLNRLRARDECCVVELDAPPTFRSFLSESFESILVISSDKENAAGSPVTTTFSSKGDVDVPAVVKSFVVVDFFN